MCLHRIWPVSTPYLLCSVYIYFAPCNFPGIKCFVFLFFQNILPLWFSFVLLYTLQLLGICCYYYYCYKYLIICLIYDWLHDKITSHEKPLCTLGVHHPSTFGSPSLWFMPLQLSLLFRFLKQQSMKYCLLLLNWIAVLYFERPRPSSAKSSPLSLSLSPSLIPCLLFKRPTVTYLPQTILMNLLSSSMLT